MGGEQGRGPLEIAALKALECVRSGYLSHFRALAAFFVLRIFLGISPSPQYNIPINGYLWESLHRELLLGMTLL